MDEGADSNNDTPLITDDLAVDQYGQKVYVNEIKLKLRILVMNQTMKKDSTEEDIEQINTAITEAREAAEGNEEVIADREAWQSLLTEKIKVGDEEASRVLKDKLEIENIINRDSVRIADIQSKMRECGRMQERVRTLPDTADKEEEQYL